MRTCLFCATTKLTREHVWPDWIVTLVKDERQGFTGTLTRSTGDVETWEQPTITHKARLLCRDCNNVKMGSIEDHIKPLLAPLIASAQTRTIDFTEQFSLATWFVVRSMIWDSIDRRLGTPYYTQADRVSFADSDPVALPDNTYIWIGTYAGEPDVSRSTSRIGSSPKQTARSASLPS